MHRYPQDRHRLADSGLVQWEAATAGGRERTGRCEEAGGRGLALCWVLLGVPRALVAALAVLGFALVVDLVGELFADFDFGLAAVAWEVVVVAIWPREGASGCRGFRPSTCVCSICW